LLPPSRDALLHVCRIHRILAQPRGNALLVGVGGSGRKSLARLAAYVGGLNVFSIEITNTYRLAEFREDLKALYRQAGLAGKPTVFLFDEAQVRVCQGGALGWEGCCRGQVRA
jgi:dynein heavy chain